MAYYCLTIEFGELEIPQVVWLAEISLIKRTLMPHILKQVKEIKHTIPFSLSATSRSVFTSIE